MRNAPSTVQGFAGNEKGTMAVLFGLSAICVLGFVGLAIDGGRAVGVRSKADAALDSAALAATRAVVNGQTKQEAEDIATMMFNTNVNGAGDLDAHYVDFVPDVDLDTRTVKVTVKAVVPTYFGSMFGVPRIEFVRTATATMNINDIELGMALDITGSMSDNDAAGRPKINGLKVAARDLIDTLMNSNGLSSVKIGLAPYSAGVNLGPYAAAATNNLSVDNCAHERAGADAYTDATPGVGGYFGAYSGGAAPVDIDPTGDLNRYSCVGSIVEPLSDDAVALKNSINSYNPFRSTAGHIGLAWGWYLVSGEWAGFWPADSEPRPYGTRNLIKAVVFMTDGIFNTAYKNGTSDDQALAICDAMKDKNVIVFTVGFFTGAHEADILSRCASDDVANAGAKLFYDARDGDALHNAFQNIAIKLTSLRLSK